MHAPFISILVKSLFIKRAKKTGCGVSGNIALVKVSKQRQVLKMHDRRIHFVFYEFTNSSYKDAYHLALPNILTDWWD